MTYTVRVKLCPNCGSDSPMIAGGLCPFCGWVSEDATGAVLSGLVAGRLRYLATAAMGHLMEGKRGLHLLDALTVQCLLKAISAVGELERQLGPQGPIGSETEDQAQGTPDKTG